MNDEPSATHAPDSGDPHDVATQRREVAAAGHRGDVAAARAALSHRLPAVRATALGAVARCEALTSADIADAAADQSPIVRRRAAELAAVTAGADLIGLLHDDDAGVAEMAAWAAGEQPPSDAVSAALMEMASGHSDALVREAAVAALGSLGVEAALPVILAAIDDKPAVRRRAVVALAAFEGDDVDAALTAALTDRDWQTRQAAEELLSIAAVDLD